MTQEEIDIFVQTLKNAEHAVDALADAIREYTVEDAEHVFGKALAACDDLSSALCGRPF